MLTGKETRVRGEVELWGTDRGHLLVFPSAFNMVPVLPVSCLERRSGGFPLSRKVSLAWSGAVSLKKVFNCSVHTFRDGSVAPGQALTRERGAQRGVRLSEVIQHRAPQPTPGVRATKTHE